MSSMQELASEFKTMPLAPPPVPVETARLDILNGIVNPRDQLGLIEPSQWKPRSCYDVCLFTVFVYMNESSSDICFLTLSQSPALEHPLVVYLPTLAFCTKESRKRPAPADGATPVVPKLI